MKNKEKNNKNVVDYWVVYEDHKLMVRDLKGEYEINLEERLLDFSVKTIKFLKSIPFSKEYDAIRYQLSKSATSIGANYQESQACSEKEFYNKISICLREARETHYWFRIVDRLDIGNKDKRKFLMNEAYEIKQIFGAIRSKLYRKLNNFR